MKYEVKTVAKHELPEGVERVIIERDAGPPMLILAGEAARAWNFVREWEDGIEPDWQPTICQPLRLAI